MYTARGSQTAIIGEYNRKTTLDIDVSDHTDTFQYHLKTKLWNVYFELRAQSMDLTPGFSSSDRSSTRDIFVSLPTYKKFYGLTGRVDQLKMRYLFIKMKNPDDTDTIDDLKKLLNSVHAKGAQASLDDDEKGEYGFTVSDTHDNDDITKIVSLILDAIFNVIIGVTMFLCFFSLAANMSANMIDQTKEIGVLRAIGFTKIRMY